MKVLTSTALFLGLVATAAQAQINAGDKKPEASLPFTMTQVATFNLPWRIAFLPDGRMLDHREGRPGLAGDAAGREDAGRERSGRPVQGQGGMLGVFVSPHYATDHSVYLTYVGAGRRRVEPGARAGPTGASATARRASTGCRCCGARCPRAGADSSARRSPSRPTASTCS